MSELATFSEIWDYRAGQRDRHMFHDDQGEVDPRAQLTYCAAEELGMIELGCLGFLQTDIERLS